VTEWAWVALGFGAAGVGLAGYAGSLWLRLRRAERRLREAR